jgi:hypothetical protein
MRHPIRVREMRWVPKDEEGASAVGVWMADRLCYVAKGLPQLNGFSRLSSVNLTEPLQVNFERMGALTPA